MITSGFYWARRKGKGWGWEVVQVTETEEAGDFIVFTCGYEEGYEISEFEFSNKCIQGCIVVDFKQILVKMQGRICSIVAVCSFLKMLQNLKLISKTFKAM